MGVEVRPPGIPCMVWLGFTYLLGARTFPREACLRTSAPAVFGAASHYAERRRVHDGVAAIEGCSVLGPRPSPGKVRHSMGGGLSSPVFSKRLGFVRG